MKKTIWVVTVLMGLAGRALADSTSEAASWLKIPTDTRAAAMGEAYSAVGDDMGAIDFNPAGLALLGRPQVSLVHSFWAQDISLEHAVYGQGWNGGGVAAAVDYLNFGSVDQYTVDSTGTPVKSGSLSPQAFAVSGGGGIQLARYLFAGVSAKWIGQQLTNSMDSAFSGNLGLLYRPHEGFLAGAALLNAGPSLQGFSLPLQTSLGVGYHFVLKEKGTAQDEKLTHSLTFSGQWDYLPNTSISDFSFGGEYWYHQLLALRAGYRLTPDASTGGLQGLTLGAAFSLQGIEISYALTTLGDFGNSNQIALSLML